MSKTPKRPRDLNQWAKRMVDIATGEASDRRHDRPRWADSVPTGAASGMTGICVIVAVAFRGWTPEYSGGAPLKAPTYDYDAPRMNPKVATSMMQFDDPMQFWSIFASAMVENPPPQNEIDCVLPQFEYLGIEIGKPWSAAGVGPIYLAEMKKAAQSIGGIIAQSVPPIGLVKNGWLIPPGEKVAFGVLCELMMENADDGTVDEVYRFCVDVVLPVTLAQLGIKNVSGDVLNTIAEVAINNGIHAEPMMVVARDTIKTAIITADSLGKSYLEGKRLV